MNWKDTIGMDHMYSARMPPASDSPYRMNNPGATNEPR
jgi:hypothetical protein